MSLGQLLHILNNKNIALVFHVDMKMSHNLFWELPYFFPYQSKYPLTLLRIFIC